MKKIRRPVGILDYWNGGKVVHIDFAYVDRIIVWVQYKTKTIAYLWGG